MEEQYLKSKYFDLFKQIIKIYLSFANYRLILAQLETKIILYFISMFHTKNVVLILNSPFSYL